MRLTRTLIILTILLANMSCIQNNPLFSTDTSATTLTINLPRGETGPGLASHLSKAVTVSNVTLTVTASDMETVEETLTISGETASGTVEVPKGKERTFTVECFDQNDILQYSGSTTEDILESEVTVTIDTEGHYPSGSTLSVDYYDAFSVELSWTRNTDVDFFAYELVRAGTVEDLYDSSTRASIVTSTDKNATTYTDDSVSPNTTYYYAIIVWDSEGLGMLSAAKEVRTPDFQVLAASGPWYIPDGSRIDNYFMNNSFAPSGASVINVEYRLRINDTGDPNTFWCGDYEIYISSSPSAGSELDELVYDNLGLSTDGGFDDDPEDDSDIYLNWRSTSYFNGEDPNQYWGISIIDNLSGDSGQWEYLELYIHYLTLSGSPGKITMTAPVSAADEGPSLNESHPTGTAQGSIEPVNTGLDKIRPPAGQ